MKSNIRLTLLLTVATVTFSAHAAPPRPKNLPCYRFPVRIFGDHTTVNLQPLFQWWSHHPAAKAADGPDVSDRPLSAWHRIVGIKTGDLGYNWQVKAEVYLTPTLRTNEMIILKNPPVAEAQTYYQLKNAIADAGRQINADQKAYQTNLKAEQKAHERAHSNDRKRNRKSRNKAITASRRAAQEKAAANTALAAEKQLEQARNAGQKKLATIPSVNGTYQIDWFALAIGRDEHGTPIYDLGVVDVNSP